MSDYRDRDGTWHGITAERAAELEAERGTVYGDPLTNHERIAGLWTDYLGTEVKPSDVAECMALVKDSRLIQSPEHLDSIEDRGAYRRWAQEWRAIGR